MVLRYRNCLLTSISALKLDNASKDPKSNRLRSPPSTARDQGSSKSIDKLIRPSKPMVSPSRPTVTELRYKSLKVRRSLN
jgi:hypothetical protein